MVQECTEFRASRRIVITSRAKAILIAKTAKSKKAEDVVVLDMRKAANFTDYFVIASGSSDRQVKAIADAIDDVLRKEGFSVRHKEGYKEAVWALIDSGNVIAHIFYKETREFYSLENLWADAPRIKIR